MAARSADSTELDPTHALRYPTVEEICKVATQTSLKNDELILAAFAKDIIDAGANGVAAIRGLDLDLETVAAIEHLIEGSAMLRSLVHSDPFILSPRLTSQVANFLGSPVIAEQCRQLVHARNALTDAQHAALIQLIGGVQEVLAHPDLIDSNANSPYESKISSAQALTSDAAVRSRLEHAPASYVLAHTPQQLLEHAQLVEPSPRNGQWRVAIQPGLKADEWQINIASRDRSGLLARLSGALSSLELNVINADIATWPDGAVLDIFTVRSSHQPNTKQVTDAVHEAMKRRKLAVGSAPFGLVATADNSAHPWHSIIRVEGPDRKGLLRDITGVLAKSGVAIHHAKIATENELARNEFEVSDRHGRKLAAAALERIQHQLR
jgi:predicted amino acid-binding ACT domain protein